MSKYNYYPGGVQVNTQLKDGVTGAQVGGYWAGGNFVQPNANAVWSDERGWVTKQEYDALKGMQAATAAASAPAAPAPAVPAAGSGGAQFNAGNLRDIADPFHTQRGQYQNQLSALMSNPDSFMQSGVFKSMMNNGLEAINRTAAAKKQLNSGNRLTDLMNYGQGKGAEQFFNYAGLLGKFAGADSSSPSGAASAIVGAQGNANSYDINNRKLGLEAQQNAQNYDIQNRQLAQGVRAYDDQQNALRKLTSALNWV